MELEPTAASFDQVRTTPSGEMVEIEADVLDIVKQIREIHPDLRVRYSEAGDYFVVYQILQENGHEKLQLVTTAQELDGRLVTRIRKVTSPQYDLAKELEENEAALMKQHRHEQREKIGEVSERLMHALRKDMNAQRVSVRVP